MNYKSIEKYIDGIFRYCIKRLNDIDDAKDLSQDILLEIIKSLSKNKVDNLDAWVWKIAHNRYARFISKSKHAITVSLNNNCMLDKLIDEYDISDDYSTEVKVVYSTVLSLAKSHRDILVDFYISELSYEQIADKHNLSIGTVKTRLFYGKQKLRERWKMKMEEKKLYERINWFICGNGDVDPFKYLNRQVTRAIVTACYTKAISIEEISLMTGIPCLYIEDEIPKLLQGEILNKEKGKYISNIIIHSESLTKNIEALLLDFSRDLADKTAGLLCEYDHKFRAIDFLGNDKPNGDLWWSLIPIILRKACEEARRLHGKVVRGEFPLRKDGGKGWIFVNVLETEQQKYFSGCNGYYKDNSIFTYYWSSKYFNEEISNYLRKLEEEEYLGIDISLTERNELLIAQGIKYNVVEKVNGRYSWRIPVFTKEQMEQLNSIKAEISKPLTKNLLTVVNKIHSMYLIETPKYLHHQIKGIFGAELNTVIAMVCDILESQGLLHSPEDEYFTKQILMTAN